VDGAFEPQPARKVQETVAELEELGYGAVWFSEAFGRNSSFSVQTLRSTCSSIAGCRITQRTFTFKRSRLACHSCEYRENLIGGE